MLLLSMWEAKDVSEVAGGGGIVNCAIRASISLSRKSGQLPMLADLSSRPGVCDDLVGKVSGRAESNDGKKIIVVYLII